MGERQTVFKKDRHGEDVVFLYDADPNCQHELDPRQWSGIKCLHCGGWFCY